MCAIMPSIIFTDAPPIVLIVEHISHFVVFLSAKLYLIIQTAKNFTEILSVDYFFYSLYRRVDCYDFARRVDEIGGVSTFGMVSG